MIEDDSDVGEEEREQVATCPYCGRSGESCEHLLLLVNVHERTAEGGLLKDNFNRRWDGITEAADDDFESAEPFSSLLQEVEMLADATVWYESPDDMPGMSFDYQAFYVKSEAQAAKARNRFA